MKTIDTLVTKKIKREVIKMIRKYLIVAITLVSFLANVVPPAHAYTQLQTPVSVTATGTLTGTTIAFAANVVVQATGTTAGQIDFTSPSGVANSGECLKIRGGTNVIGGRVIVYTDNASYFTSQDHDPRVKKVGAVYKPTGLDGAGLVGQAETAYVAPLIWGITTTPNVNSAYTFDGNLTDGIGEVYVIDRGHQWSFVPTGTPGLDTQAMYRKDGTAVTNAALEGVDASGSPIALYPQFFGAVGTGDANNWDLYDKIVSDTSRVVISEQLTKNIATIAYSISIGVDADAGYYICQVPNLTTAASSDSVKARLGKTDGTAGTEIYVPVGAVFTGLPAQAYTTTKLYVAIVQD